MAMRIVLDTNVVLDLLVFRDASAAPIARALDTGAAVGLTDGECRAELARVLAYPQFRLDAAAMSAALARYDAWSQEAPAAPVPSAKRVPRCSDADDQKFLDLAFGCAAALLITKDRALLKLARRTSGAPLIVSPDAAASLLAAAAKASAQSLLE